MDRERDKGSDTDKKIDTALEWLEQASDKRRGSGCYGRMTVELVWEDGFVKRLRLSDETVIETMTTRVKGILKLEPKKPPSALDSAVVAS